MSQPHFEPKHSVPLSGLPELSPLSATRPISAEYFLEMGNQFYNSYLSRSFKKDLTQAIDAYRQVLELNPSLPEAQVKLASALWDQGEIQLDTAIHYCKSALKNDPNYGEGHLFLGYFLRRAGKLEDAMTAFQQAIAKAGVNGPARAKMALGRILIQKASLATKASGLKRLTLTGAGLSQFIGGCCLLPSDKQAFSVVKSALFTDIQILSVTGLGRFLKKLRFSGQVTRLYQWASGVLPQESIFPHLLGDIYAEQRRWEKAIDAYHRAQELNPDDLPLHKKLGNAYSQCDDSANAAKSLEKLVAADAADFDTLYTLSQIYTDTTQYMRALYYLKELAHDEPENPYVHSNMAYVLFKLEDYDGAIQEYQSAVRLGEDSVWTATIAQTLGTVYYQIKEDLTAASEMFQFAFKKDPSNLESLAMLGDIYTEQSEYEQAIQVYRHILSAEPHNADCYNYLGYLLWQLDKNDEAVTAYNKAIELHGENPIAYNNLGVIFLDEKCQLQQALEMFQKATRLKPDYTLACFNIGRAREAMGQTSEAARAYTDALALNADNPELTDEEIQERLDHLFQVP